MTPYRHNNKWTINELLSLQREYQLLEMSIQEIANKHGRTVEAILFKLQSEQFIDRWIDATGYQEYSKTKSSLYPNNCFIKLVSESSINFLSSKRLKVVIFKIGITKSLYIFKFI